MGIVIVDSSIPGARLLPDRWRCWQAVHEVDSGFEARSAGGLGRFQDGDLSKGIPDGFIKSADLCWEKALQVG